MELSMKPLVLLSFSLAFLTQCFADDSSATQPTEQVRDDKPSPSMSMQSEDAQWCLSPYHEMHASIRHNEANGIGYKEGYTTLEAFGIYDGWGSGFMPFVDLRGHIFNNGKLAGNVGIGERTLFTSINHTFGSYLYYDVRRVGHHLTVNQLSPGIELVGERMEYRVNGYFPVGKNKGNKFGYAFDKFTGNNILLKFKQNQAMIGFDAEVGAHIPQNTTYDVYAAAGPYYFHSSNASAWGGKVRLLGRYKEYVTLEVGYSYDKLFRNVVQGSLAFALPFGRKLQRCGQGCNRGCPQDNLLLSRAAFAPSRLEIPVVKKVHRKEKAIDPATGLPWVVWFVNNTSHSAGTFESPFPTLLQAQNASSPNDMIYVFSGDGTTTGMNAGITLQDGQSFFGSGIKQQFPTTKGTMTIPAMSPNYPSITNTTSVVILGNGNVVSGFNITDAAANAAGITSPITPHIPINGATIMNNIVNVIGDAAGIQVVGFGDCNISNNQVTGVSTRSGIAVQAMGGTMNGVISNNAVSGEMAGLGVSFTSGSGSFTIEGNTITNDAGDGILAFLAGDATLTVTGNTVNSNAGGAGFVILDDMAAPFLANANVFIDSNNIVITSPTAVDGILVSINTSPVSNSNVSVTNNTVQSTTGAGFTGINITTANANTICLDWDENTVVTVPGATAYGFTATAPSVINIESPIVGNVGGPMASTGNVNFVAPGTCGD
jgi:hypothetical protein